MQLRFLCKQVIRFLRVVNDEGHNENFTANKVLYAGPTETGKDVSDFLLMEYKNIAQAHFNAQEMLSKWVRFYFLVIAAPLTLLVLFAGKGQTIDLNSPRGFFPILTLLTGTVGIFISLIIFDIRLDAALYARTVNGIRKYFLDRDLKQRNYGLMLNAKSNLGPILLDPSPYVVLPGDISKPSMTKLSINGWIFVSMFILINSSYICYWPYVGGFSWLSIVRAVILIWGHPFVYKQIGKHKEKTYTQSKNHT